MPLVTCPGCGRKIELPAHELSLPSITCAACETSFRPASAFPSGPGEDLPDVRFSCPNCKHPYQMPASRSGSKFHCPQCGQKLQVPAPPSASRTVLAPLLPDPPVQLVPLEMPQPAIKPFHAQATGFPRQNLCGTLSLIFGAVACGLLFMGCMWLLSPLFAIAGLTLGIIGRSHPARTSATIGIVLSVLALFLVAVAWAELARILRR